MDTLSFQANTSQLESVESSRLSGIRSPCLAAIQQCADDTGIADCHVFGGLEAIQTRVVRRARVVTAFPILLSIYLSKEIVGDGGAEVRKVMDGVEFVVVDVDDWRWLCVLY